MPKASTFYEPRSHALPCPWPVAGDALRAVRPRPGAASPILRDAGQQRSHAQGLPECDTPFLVWCAAHGVEPLSAVEPIHVAAFVKVLEKEFSAPTVKQHLAALRMLFDWLVTGHILDTNPAHAVRGPKHVVRKGKTPALSPDEIRQLLDSIEAETLMGLRDRALIALMTYTFARVGAAVKMRVEDYFIQGRRNWVRMQEGGEEHQVPCHHRLDEYLHAYFQRAGIEPDAKGYLFRSMTSKAGTK